jgi:hypothetical protein
MAHPETYLRIGRLRVARQTGSGCFVESWGSWGSTRTIVVSASPNAGSTDRNRGLGAVRRFRGVFLIAPRRATAMGHYEFRPHDRWVANITCARHGGADPAYRLVAVGKRRIDHYWWNIFIPELVAWRTRGVIPDLSGFVRCVIETGADCPFRERGPAGRPPDWAVGRFGAKVAVRRSLRRGTSRARPGGRARRVGTRSR